MPAFFYALKVKFPDSPAEFGTCLAYKEPVAGLEPLRLPEETGRAFHRKAFPIDGKAPDATAAEVQRLARIGDPIPWDESDPTYGKMERLDWPSEREGYLAETFAEKGGRLVVAVTRLDDGVVYANSLSPDVGKKRFGQWFYLDELDASHLELGEILFAAQRSGEPEEWDAAKYGERHVSAEELEAECRPFRKAAPSALTTFRHFPWVAVFVEKKGRVGGREIRTMPVTPLSKPSYDHFVRRTVGGDKSYAAFLAATNSFADHAGTGELWEPIWPNSIPPELGTKYAHYPLAVSKVDEGDHEHAVLFAAASKAPVKRYGFRDEIEHRRVLKKGPLAPIDSEGKCVCAETVQPADKGKTYARLYVVPNPKPLSWEDWSQTQEERIDERLEAEARARNWAVIEVRARKEELMEDLRDVYDSYVRNWPKEHQAVDGWERWHRYYESSVPPSIARKWLTVGKAYFDDLNPGNPEHETLLRAARESIQWEEGGVKNAESNFGIEVLSEDEVETPFLSPDLSKRLEAIAELALEGDNATPRGILMHGPPGTGKSITARWFAAICGASYIELSVADLKKGYVGQSGEEVKKLWDVALATEGLVVMFVDECDGIFARRDGNDADGTVKEIVGEFLPSWTNAPQGKVIVVGATNQLSILDPAIVSRFTYSFELAPPTGEVKRKLALAAFSKKGLSHLVSGLPPETLEEMTSGKSGRDIQNLADKASIEARVNGRSTPTAEDLLAAAGIKKAPPRASGGELSWDALIIDDKTKKQLQFICMTLAKHEQAAAKGWSVPRGVLMFGPPGTGKTLIAKTMAAVGKINFKAVSGSDMKGQYLGQTSPAVQRVFADARSQAPCILFLDELESIVPARSGGTGDSFSQETVTTMLQEMNECVSPGRPPVFVLGATNHPEMIDPAILSRLPTKVEIALPDARARAAILGALLVGKTHDLSEEDIKDVAAATEGKSGRDLRSIVEMAEQDALIESNGDFEVAKLSRRHFSA